MASLLPIKPLPQQQQPDPDPFCAYNVAEQTPIVIDNGAYRCRAGWASDASPQLEFLSLSAKYRQRRDGDPVVVGSDIPYHDWSRLAEKSPFDGNIVCNFDAQENILDHIFSHLNINGGNVAHPVLMTEALCNPNYCREGMNELLFECYDVPAVTYGIDALFSYHHNLTKSKSLGTPLLPGLIISASHRSTHVIPIIDDVGLDAWNSKRINLGGHNMARYLRRLLQLKYPIMTRDIVYGSYEMMFHDLCYFSSDYSKDLAHCATRDGLLAINQTIQIPFDQRVAAEKSAEELQRTQAKRKEQGKRLQEMAANRRAEKLLAQEEKLNQLTTLLESKSKTSKADFTEALSFFELETENDLVEEIERVQSKIKKIRNKQSGIQETEDDKEKKDFPLLDIPDELLSDDQVKEKRKQRLIKGGIEARERARQQKQQKQKELEELEKQDELLRQRDFAAWQQDYMNRRQIILDRLKERKRKKEQLSDRRSAVSMQRMRSIAALAENDDKVVKKKKTGPSSSQSEDTFGADDNDWLVYREISKDEDSDEEEDDLTQLAQLETTLSKHVPDFDVDKVSFSQSGSLLGIFQNGPGDGSSIAEEYHLNVNVERIRVPEILFQPSIVGVDQAGLAQVIASVFSAYDATTQQQLADNVFLTGGLSQMTGFLPRIEAELRQIRPFQSHIGISQSRNPRDAWFGARQFANSPDFRRSCVSRKDYDEQGHEYLNEHMFSNRYIRLARGRD